MIEIMCAYSLFIWKMAHFTFFYKVIWTTNRKNELFVIYFLWSRDFKTASFFYYSFNLCFFLALFDLDCLSYQTKLHKMKINQYFLWYLFSKFFKLNWRYWKNMYGSAKSSLFNLSHTKYEIVFNTYFHARNYRG